MKINRGFYLLLPSLLICFIRADYVSIAAPTDPPVQTDKKIYSVTLTPESFQVVIKWTYTNRTSATVYRARSVTILALEKKVGDEWVVAKRDAIPFTQDAISIEDKKKGKPWGIINEEFARINPGETRWGTWDIRPGKGSFFGPSSKAKRRFELKEVPGVYRLVLGLFGTETTEGEDLPSEVLPLEERVSNEFEIVEKE